MSFGPFLGGKRICLGKTFAENIGKCVLAIICSQLEFEFSDKKLYEVKPLNSFQPGIEEPPYNVYLKVRQ